MQLFNVTFVFPASFTFFTVLTRSPLVAGKNGWPVFFSHIFVVSTALIFAAGFTQTLSNPFENVTSSTGAWDHVHNSTLLPLLTSYLFSSALAWVPTYAAASKGSSPPLWGLPKGCSPSGVSLPWHVLPQPLSPQSVWTLISLLAWNTSFHEHALSHFTHDLSFDISSVLLMCPLHFSSSQ